MRTDFLALGLMIVGQLAAQTAADLKSLEDRGEAQFAGHDYQSAEKTFNEALRMAQAVGDLSHAGLYYLRIGNCRTRVGDFTASLDAYEHTIAISEASGDNEQLANAVHGAALQLAKLGRMDEALPLGQREYALTQQCGHPAHQVRAIWLVATQYGSIGKVREEISMLNRALTLSRTTTDVSVTAVMMDSLAIAYIGLGDLEAASRLEKEILAIPQLRLNSTGTTYSTAVTYNNLGEIQMRTGHPADARKSFEKSVEGSRAPDDWRVHATALINLAGIRNSAGEIAAADAGFHEALEITRRVNFPDLQSAAYQLRSDSMLIRGDLRNASADAAEALRIARQLSSPNRVYKALLSLGKAKAAAGQGSAARADFDEALRIAETLRTQSPGDISDLTGVFANLLPLYQASVRNLAELHLPAEALQRAEQAKARVLMDILLRGGVDERNVMTPAESIEQGKFRKRMEAANAAVAGNPSVAATRALQDVMVEFRQARRVLYDNHPELAVRSADFEPAKTDQIATLLPRPGSALLDYFFVPSGVVLFVVRQGVPSENTPAVSSYLLPDPTHSLAAEARAFREQLASRELGYKTAAHHLFNRLLAPAMTSLAGTTDWIVSPDGALWDVPFGVLVDPAGRHVIESRTVTLTPSLTASFEMRRLSKAVSQRSPGPGDIQFLALGNPLPSPAPLPDAAREVAEIGVNYPRSSSLVLTGTSATAAEFRDKAPSARIIHLAAHAGLNNSDPLSSWVSLGAGAMDSGGDGMVTALDIMSLHLHADLVVLSACETALGSSGPGEGMLGMGWALSAAGASSSVLSLWKVDSAASREFMTSFYRNLASGGRPTTRSAALRQASLRLLQSPGYRHPFYWAAFSLWGDGR